jgi:hypothetical protein
MVDEIIDHHYPSIEWLQTVSDAVGFSPEVIKSLIDSWHFLGKTSKEMQERLIILAELNGKKLFFSDPTQSL